MRIDTAIVLAGGFGTRLAAVVADVPKPMAPVAGRPFLERLLDRLAAQGLARVVLATGHKREIIQRHFGTSYAGLRIDYSEESTPLGTGGAVRQAIERYELPRALVLNGDTYCSADLRRLADLHGSSGAPVTLTLVETENASRYGAVELDEAGVVQAFREKQPVAAAGLINAGIYALDAGVLQLAGERRQFSFEQDILQAHAGAKRFRGFVADAFFIDIGVPDDYYRAQTELATA